MNRMKKIIILLVSAFIMGTSAYAWNRIPLTVSYEKDDMPVGNGHSKSPIQAPTVYIEDYTLAFVADHPEYILNIKDEAGEVIFTTIVYSTEMQVVLPSTLSGDHEIELIMGYWKFTGFINLSNDYD